MTRLRMFDGLSGLPTRFGKTKPVVRPARNSFRRAATSGEMSTKLTDAAPCGGCEDHEHPVLWTLDPGKLCHGFRRDRWSPLLRGFYERQVQFVCIPFLRIEWVAVRIFSRCNDRSCHAKVGIDRLR